MDFETLNANKPYILSEFTEVLRNLIRASASTNNHQAVYKAADQMQSVMRMVEKCKEDITWQDMFAHAVGQLKDYKAEARERHIYGAACRGMSLFTELTCEDSSAMGRISQREHSFLMNMESVLKWNDPSPGPRKKNKM